MLKVQLYRVLDGCGLAWTEFKRLVVETTANQDPLVTKGPSLIPLLGIDVWEHAHYLQYKNVKPDYLKNIWKVMNWKYASEVYENEFPRKNLSALATNPGVNTFSWDLRGNEMVLLHR
ncbi:Superoxide dismutase [Actinidia chinensis var. chinensis]|uniref:superoxide dismutase n=1 Tax=Actinidia chinensis var. chinensis TaxID=1590841 RepID=A0A2R6RWL6_ACTCC|nr:Superoxide dismutase [Actinidia chinensis var. chinensis]